MNCNEMLTNTKKKVSSIILEKYLEAIDSLEELLLIKKQEFGTNSDEFTETCK